MTDEADFAARHPLAHRGGLALILTLIAGSGGMCPECGYGTRATSKNWARCKRCDTRVRRRPMEDVASEIEDRAKAAICGGDDDDK